MKCYNCKCNVNEAQINKLKKDCIKYDLNFNEEAKYILCSFCNDLSNQYKDQYNDHLEYN